MQSTQCTPAPLPGYSANVYMPQSSCDNTFTLSSALITPASSCASPTYLSTTLDLSSPSAFMDSSGFQRGVGTSAACDATCTVWAVGVPKDNQNAGSQCSRNGESEQPRTP